MAPAVAAAPRLLPVILLLGCSGQSVSVNPADWWHALEGGKIAEQRPPPPNADAPYPNLGSVPERPVPTDAATRGRIATGLLADRANAQYAGAIAPDPSLQGNAPLASAHPPTPPPAAESDTPSASLQAATASPAAGAPAKPQPGPGLGQSPSSNRPATPPGAATEAAPVEAAPLTLPTAPPPAPHVQGVDIPAITLPTPPPVAPPTPPPPPKPSSTASAVVVPFQPGAANIAQDSQDALRALALRRGAAPMDAIGYGDVAGADPAGQSAALPLALARARAVAAVLIASGVPAALVHVQAEAEGRGGAARIAQAGADAGIVDAGGAARNTN